MSRLHYLPAPVYNATAAAIMRSHGLEKTMPKAKKAELQKVAKPLVEDKPVWEEPDWEPRLFGYARVSTDDQRLDLQLAALRKFGVLDENIYYEKLSATSNKRDALKATLKLMYPRDTLVVYSFSRVSRTLTELMSIVDKLKADGKKIVSTSEPSVDPFTTAGRLHLQLTGALDENERLRARDRTLDGMAELKRQGRKLGRTVKLDATAIKQIKKLKLAGLSVNELAKKFDCSTSAIYNVTKPKPRN